MQSISLRLQERLFICSAKALATGCMLLCAACGGGSGNASTVVQTAQPPISYQQPSASICDASLAVSGGLLCAIQPSRLDTNSRDIAGNGNAQDILLGFGYHTVAFPPSGTLIKGVYIHLTGSYGRPYNPASAVFGSASFLGEALSADYIILQIAYNNRLSVNIDECGGDISRINVDNCSGDVRMEKIVGADVSTVNDTPLADSIEFRIMKLVDYLVLQGVRFPFEIVNNGIVNWQLLRVGGHSQGATHALYIGKYFSALHACMLAGGYDVADTVPSLPPELLADWLLDQSVGIDADKFSGVFSVDDPSSQNITRSLNFLGLTQNVNYTAFSGAPYFNASGVSISGHSAALNDPRYENLRMQACFGN